MTHPGFTGKGDKMQHILNYLVDILELGNTAILCGIVRKRCSASRTSGARIWVCQDGSIVAEMVKIRARIAA